METQLVLLGDHDTAEHRGELSQLAAQRGCTITETFSFVPGEAAANDDLTQVDAVVLALGRAISDHVPIWVPFAGPDLGREQHWRRLSLVLQRHGLNLLLGRDLESCPTTGGFSEIDFALRREVQAVDELDHAALAAVGAESLGHEIELALVAAGSAASVTPAARRGRAGAGSDAGARRDSPMPPSLPSPTAPWTQRRSALKRYVRWLVHGCGVTHVATARVLNSTGQRTPKGRRWQPGTVSALLNGRYDHGAEDHG
ncbi:hypothetical protein AWC26_17760 [Mycobacterium shimoidei]|uniref:hypothetical protein n=1 Tax=Mycobacterium shimoidei TaxID=29313 RepID=UPI000848F1D6|nr:hypothetical protein [Mycobacterium shimoidei]MCV7260880.1 hypothetical protein [Mycobacterium shimoidei]ODR05588.1 hypothetical protein BHQ16_22080 [Mycobacterium shimoidei]ORW78454.1 hypothetical protein AWC26_17760 [Mycobacterium shimoidei]